MAYESNALNATLAAAAGENAELQQELRSAFLDSVERQADLLSRARCDGNWEMAALRLRAIAASFHADDLISLADQALEGAPGEPGIVRSIRGLVAEMRG